jgi:hypothetical protein
MLIIRDNQITLLQKQRRLEFIRKLERHARRNFPDRCQSMEGEKLRMAIDDVVDRAEHRGLCSERAICLYLNVAICFGLRFEENSNIRWAAPIEPAPGEELDPCWINRVAGIAVRTLEEKGPFQWQHPRNSRIQ